MWRSRERIGGDHGAGHLAQFDIGAVEPLPPGPVRVEGRAPTVTIWTGRRAPAAETSRPVGRPQARAVERTVRRRRRTSEAAAPHPNSHADDDRIQVRIVDALDTCTHSALTGCKSDTTYYLANCSDDPVEVQMLGNFNAYQSGTFYALERQQRNKHAHNDQKRGDDRPQDF